MIDTLLKNRSKFIPPKVWKDLKLQDRNYFVITLHRPANVDKEEKLEELIQEIINNSQGLPIIFPAHPRTAKILSNSRY